MKTIRKTTVAGWAIAAACAACATDPASIQRKPNVAVEPVEKSVFLDDEAACTSFIDAVSDDQNKAIVDLMGSHMHRLNHMLWHATRNSWSELSPKDQKAIQAIDPSWGKHAPICPLPAASIETNRSPAGEEFLLMHHRMVDTLRGELVARKLPCIAGWKTLPAKDDPTWPLPPGDPQDSSKSDETYQLMKAWMKKFDDPKYLKGKSLSHIGYLVEFSLHNHMHMRWAPKPKAHDDASPLDSGDFSRKSLLEDTPYDTADYHWLGNPYSAHVDRTFWKLHGWVDNVIPNWLKANGYDSISSDCAQAAEAHPERKRCYQWTSSWTGPHDHRAKGVPGGNQAGRNDGLDEETDRAARSAISKVFGKAGFGNPKFDEFQKKRREDLLNPRASGSGAAGAKAAPQPDLTDPFVYVKKFGACAR